MKEKFLSLVEEVKNTGIVEVLSMATTQEEFESAWRKFEEENIELFEKLNSWADEFRSSEEEFLCLFEDREEIENPMDIVIVIYIIGDEYEISECHLFEDWVGQFQQKIAEIDNGFYKKIAELMLTEYICNIKAADIFSY